MDELREDFYKVVQQSSELNELLRNNDLDSIKVFMSNHSDDRILQGVTNNINTYDKFLAIINDRVIDGGLIRSMLNDTSWDTDIERRVIDYLLKCSVDPIFFIDSTTAISGYICECVFDHTEECIYCLKDTYNYFIITYIISKGVVDIDELKEKYSNNKFLHLILNNLHVDV